MSFVFYGEIFKAHVTSIMGRLDRVNGLHGQCSIDDIKQSCNVHQSTDIVWVPLPVDVGEPVRVGTGSHQNDDVLV